jgi:rod shape-determining protein MreC
MENLITRYRNVSILVAVLFAQVLGLAVQVKRNAENEPTRLIRIWTVSAVTPFEKGLLWVQHSTSNLWHEYLYLRGVRQENRDLKAEIERLKVEQVRLKEDAEQAHRLQALLGFREKYISQTLAAQVIGSSGSLQSRSVYIDKGWGDGVKPDMPVITADGVVGKVLRVFGSKRLEPSISEVLLIDDQTSGVGAILEKSRLQGILRGSPAGGLALERVTPDEKIQTGERVLTSGGDQIFPKGFPVGTVTNVSSGSELFLSIQVKSAVNLSKLEEVLVITKQEEKEPVAVPAGPLRAVDILAQRLPSVPDKPPAATTKPGAGSGAAVAKPPAASPANPKPPPSTGTAATVPAGTGVVKEPGASPALVKPAAKDKTATPVVKALDKGAQPSPPEPKPEPVPPEDHPQ